MRPIILLVLMTQACSEDAGPSNKSVDSAEDEDSSAIVDMDSGLEEAGSLAPEGITASLSEAIVTVVEVSWETEQATQGYVEFGETEEYGQQTPLTDSGTTHSLLLLGMPASTEVHFRVVTTDGSETSTSADRVIATGDLPPALPDFQVSGTSLPGYRTFTVIGGWCGVLIVDRLGRVVWYYEHTDDDAVSIQSRLTMDGKYMVFNSPCHLTKNPDCGSMIWVTLDGVEKIRVPVDRLGHDFTQLSDGTICTIVKDAREIDGVDVSGDRLVEIDIDGEEREVWNAWDDLEVPAAEEELDWTHANAINFNEEEDAYYVGLTFLSSIFKIDRSSGEVLWQLGGEDSSFTYSEGSERLFAHHNFDIEDQVLTLFVNGTGMMDPSRILQYELDEEAMTITEIWSYVPELSLYVYALGDVSVISENTFHITYSTAGYVEQLEAGVPTWTLSASFPNAFGYSNFYESLYP
jgi:hypothetical protein